VKHPLPYYHFMAQDPIKPVADKPNVATTRLYIPLTALLAAFAFLVLFCIRNIYSYDYWWHIASGRWILENGIMRADPFSFTAKDAPLVDPYWLAQILLYLLGSTVVIFKTVIITAAFIFCLLVAPRQIRITLPAAALVLLGAFVAHERFLCRPEIFTLLFSAITLWVIFNLSKRKNYAIFIIPALTVLWANMHPGWVLAPLLLAAYAGGRLLGRWFGLSTHSESSRRELMTLAAAGLCFIAALANPYFTQIVTYPFRLTFSTSHDIGAFVEWVSPLPRLTSTLFTTELLHFKIMTLALIGSFILNYRRFDFGHVAVAALTFILALTSYRHFGIFTLATIPIILTNLKPFWQEQFLPRLSNAKFKIAHLGAIIAIIATSAYYCEEAVTNHYYAKRELYNMSFGVDVSDTSFSWKLVHLEARRDGVNRIFNSYELGGYLACVRHSWVEVFIDGRLVHYPKEVYEDYVRVQTDPKYWDKLVEKYDIHSAALIHNLPRMQALIKHIHHNPRWDFCRADNVICYYQRNDVAFYRPALMFHPSPDTYLAFDTLSKARFWLNVEEYKVAVETLEGFVLEYSENGKLHLYYGRALAGTGKLKDAKTAFEKAVKLLPDSVEAHLNLGVTYWKLGEKDKARKSWQRVLEIDSQNEQALVYLRHGTQEPK
jgi:tetratricopeptide (TPR) repeat protein